MAKAWSNRFEEGLNSKIFRFNSSLNFDINLLHEDIDGSIAHAQMLGECALITKEEALKIQDALEKIRLEVESKNFNSDEEDIHYLIEKKLIALLGPLGKKLHTGRSRNDQVATDLRLWLRKNIDLLDKDLEHFQVSLLNLAKDHIYTLIPGYTHLQRAQPLSLAHHLLAYIEMLNRDRSRIKDVRKRVNISPLGAAALAGTSVKIDRQLTAKLLGFDDVCSNSLDGVSDRDFVVEFISAASLIMVHLSRISEEIILWASEEFSFVSLTDRCSTGSSLMPQKKNPDVPELVRGKSGRVFGHLQALLTIIKGLPLAYNKDLQEDKEALFDSVVTARSSVQAMSILFEEGLIFNKERLALAVESDFSNATDVADYLVAKGIPFREAYEKVGGLVRFCMQNKVLLKDLKIDQWQSVDTSFESDIYEKLSPKHVVASRNSKGGTGFQRVEAEVQAWLKRLEIHD